MLNYLQIKSSVKSYTKISHESHVLSQAEPSLSAKPSQVFQPWAPSVSAEIRVRSSAFSRLARHQHAPLRERVLSTPTPARVQGLIRVGPAFAADSRSASPCVTAGLGGSRVTACQAQFLSACDNYPSGSQLSPTASSFPPLRVRHVADHSFPATKIRHVSPLVLNPNSFPKNQSKLPDFFPKLNM